VVVMTMMMVVVMAVRMFVHGRKKDGSLYNNREPEKYPALV